jgi:hypothetical protein
MRLPGLNMLSHNRFVFATGFSVLALAVVGLDVAWRGEARVRAGYWLPVVLLAGLGGWWAYRALNLPEPLASQLEAALRGGRAVRGVTSLEGLARAQGEFARTYAIGAGLCAIGILGWLGLRARALPAARVAPVLGALMVAELLGFAHGVSPQCDPALDYPTLPVLSSLGSARPGRMLAVRCFPPDLNLIYGLEDLRGYDGADPARMLELLDLARDERHRSVPYALTQWYVPLLEFVPPRSVRVPAVLDLLHLRYLVFRGAIPQGMQPALVAGEYWVLENPDVLPRAFVPRRVLSVPDPAQRLERMAAANFDPRELAFTEIAVDLPERARGAAVLTEALPDRVSVAVTMETEGLLVLADAWYEGWHAEVDGAELPILRVDHALRGVVLPRGESLVHFEYRPASFRWGVRLALAGLIAILAWAVLVARAARTPAGASGSRLKD